MSKRNSSSSSSGGIGFVGLLTIVLVTLKLLEKIEWSWFWVLSPIWIGGLCAISMIVIAIALGIWINK